MGKKGHKYRAVSPGSQPAHSGRKGKQQQQPTGWKAAGEGHRLGGSAPAEPYNPPSRGKANRASQSSASEKAPGTLFAVPAGLRRVKEGGDGSCLFHAIARQALDDPDQAGLCRTQICDWMRSYLLPSAIASGRCPFTEPHLRMLQDQRAEFFGHPNGSDPDAAALRYVQKMRRSDEWGSGLEALCAAYRYGRPVYIWSPEGTSVLEPPTAKPQPIRLSHNGRNHWDSLMPLEGHSVGNSKPVTDDDNDVAFQIALNASLASSSSNSQQQATVTTRERRLGGEEGAQFESRRSLAASAALARLEQEERKGLADASRAAVLREEQAKQQLLGQLAERCALRREEMPLGVGLASISALKAMVEARGPNRGVAASSQGEPLQATAQAATGRRWGKAAKAADVLDAVEVSEAAKAADVFDAVEVSEAAKAAAALDALELTEAAETAAALDALELTEAFPGGIEVAEAFPGGPVLKLNLIEDEVTELQKCIAILQDLGFNLEEAEIRLH